jgi:hypothetical protein
VSSGDWIAKLADDLRRFEDVADRLDALEALIIDLTRAFTSLTARIDAQFNAEERLVIRERAIELERQKQAEGRHDRIRTEFLG